MSQREKSNKILNIYIYPVGSGYPDFAIWVYRSRPEFDISGRDPAPEFRDTDFSGFFGIGSVGIRDGRDISVKKASPIWGSKGPRKFQKRKEEKGPRNLPFSHRRRRCFRPLPAKAFILISSSPSQLSIYINISSYNPLCATNRREKDLKLPANLYDFRPTG